MSATFFGVQIAIEAKPGDPLRRAFWEAVRSGAKEQGLADKRAYHHRLVALLEGCAAKWRFGTWDFVPGGGGEAQFDEWVSGLERCAEEDPGDAFDDEHVLVSLVFLLEGGSDAESVAGERCDLPEDRWHLRATYAHLVATVRMLPFAGVRADGAYVVPGEGGAGLSAEELQGEGWNYLRPLG